MKSVISIVLLLCLTIIAAPLLGDEIDKGVDKQGKEVVTSVAEKGVDDKINDAVKPLTKILSSIIFFEVNIFGAPIKLVVAWLILGALFFTLYLGFINIRGFGHSISLVRGVYDDPTAPGEVSHFQALATALSGTVGNGNIGGVAVAIALGGPGAVFWLIVAGFLGMSSKFVECTLGVTYRRENEDGSVSGGPMYYLEHGLALVGMPRVGKVIGSFYAIGMVIGCLGIGNMFQSNQAFEQVVYISGGAGGLFSGKGWLFGIVLALVVGLVIIGGIKSIARVTVKLVPFMAIFYVIGAITIIIMNYEAIPFAINAIFSCAFAPDAIQGGMLGVMIIGFKRGVFSNEAGIGSASIAHSAVRTKEPITEGAVSLLGPFIDTIIICSITSLVIVTTYYQPGKVAPLVSDPALVKGIALTSNAFKQKISWSPYFLSIAVIMFAVSTMISWSYYGLKGWTYLVGEGRFADMGFKFVFCCFVALGCSIKLDAVLDFSDALIFVLCVPNVLGMLILAPSVKREMNSYFARVKNGEIKKYKK